MLPLTTCTLFDPTNIHTATFPTHPLTHTTEFPEQCLSEVLLTSEGKMKHKGVLLVGHAWKTFKGKHPGSVLIRSCCSSTTFKVKEQQLYFEFPPDVHVPHLLSS